MHSINGRKVEHNRFLEDQPCSQWLLLNKSQCIWTGNEVEGDTAHDQPWVDRVGIMPKHQPENVMLTACGMLALPSNRGSPYLPVQISDPRSRGGSFVFTPLVVTRNPTRALLRAVPINPQELQSGVLHIGEDAVEDAIPNG
jgi:hypothetical protein